jgi:hypothetical protein
MESKAQIELGPARVLELQDRISRVGRNLANAIRGVVDSVPGGPHRPQELARTLGINKDLSSRALSACRKQDPFAAAHLMPGPEPLRRLLRAAARRGVDPSVIKDAEEAVRQFDLLIRTDAGDRAGLDAIIGAWLPDARQRFELTAKQAMFKGAASLKGLFTETALVTFMAYPSSGAEDEWCDTALLAGLLGLRRLRPGATVQYSSVLHEREHTRATLNGERVGVDREPLLREFCQPASVEIRTRMEGDRVHYTVADNGVGPRSAVDLWLAEFYARNHPRWRRPSAGPRRFFYATVEQPARTLIFDMLVHEEVWPGCEPELVIYDTTVNGVADVNDPTRNVDRLDLAESIQPLGRSLSGYRASEVPNYLDLLRHVCKKMNWDDSRFRAYRCRIHYPFYGSQVCMVFDPPPAPGALEPGLIAVATGR